MKKIFVVIIVFALFALLSFNVNAEEDFLQEQIDEIDVDEFVSVLGEDAQNILSELGLDDMDFEKMFNISPGKIFKTISEIVQGKIKSPLKSFSLIIAMLIITSSIECFVSDGTKIKSVINSVSILICLLSVCKPIFTVAAMGISAIKVSSRFLILFVPAFVAVISLNGNPQLAFSYNTLILSFGQIVVQVANGIIKPIVGIFFSLGMASAISPEFNFKELCSQIKKTATLVTGFLSAMFFSMLSIKGVLANASDSITARGVKFLISSFVPIIGGTISSGFSSIVGSLNMLKNMLGVFCVSAIAIVNLPVIIELAIWTLLLRLAASISDTLQSGSISDALKIIADSTVFINVILILSCVIIIISTALMLLIKAGT